MDVDSQNPETHSTGPPRNLRIPATRTLLLSGAVAVAVLAILALTVLERLNRVELQVAKLAVSVEESDQLHERAEQKADAAIQRAMLAEQNARQAAVQRNRAVEVQAKSEKEVELLRQQAETAKRESMLAQEKAEDYKKQHEQEMVRLEQVLGQIAETRRTAMGLVMTLGSDSIQFDFDKAEIKPQSRDILNRVAGALITLKGYSVYVYGYTDDVGTKEYNQNLSERRAQAVRDSLVRAGLNPQIISVKGLGESDPRALGETPEARAKNRRVEIGIVDSRLLLSELQRPENPKE
jgi:outer membrane protein OmpA-like peptidoglycan-associated protein